MLLNMINRNQEIISGGCQHSDNVVCNVLSSNKASFCFLIKTAYESALNGGTKIEMSRDVMVASSRFLFSAIKMRQLEGEGSSSVFNNAF
jgi:hypothetical protein